MIKRLPPASSNYSIALKVGKRLRPYFEKWYKAEKQAGDTPDSFALRCLKDCALLAYLKEEFPLERDRIAAVKTVSDADLKADIELLNIEVD